MYRTTKLVFLDFDDRKNHLLGAGQAKATYEVGRRLAAKGYDITVVSSRFPGSYDRREAGINYRHIGLGTRYIRLNNAAYILCVPFVISRLRADLVIECFTAPISTLFTPLWTGTPVVAVPSSFEARRFSRLYHLPFFLIERLGMPLYRYFLPYTPYQDQKMRQVNPQVTSSIVGQGVNPGDFRVTSRTPRHLLFLGRLDLDQKGLDLLLTAFARVASRLKLPLVIAGHGPDRDRVLALIAKLRLGKSVRLTGPAYGLQKKRLLSRSLLAVIPSRHEGFCIFALEALAAGVPVGGFDIPGLSWLSPEVSFKSPAYDVELFADQLINAAKKAANPRLKTRCRKLARNFSWDEVANKYHSFFQTVLAPQAVPSPIPGYLLHSAKK